MADDLVDEFAIRRVLALYCQRCDDGDFGALIELFTPDGTFTYGGQTVGGSADLRAYFEKVQTPERRGRHLTTNIVVDLDSDRATASSDWAFLAFVDGTLGARLSGRYRDQLVRTDGTWQIAARDVTPLRPVSV